MKEDKNKLLRSQLRKKYMKYGAESLSEQEMITLILSYSEKGDVMQLAERLSHEYGSLNTLIDADPYLIMQSGEISEQTAVLLKSVSRLAYIRSGSDSRFRYLKSSHIAKEYFSSRLIGSSCEKLAAVSVNDKLRVMSFCMISSGTGIRIDASCRNIIEFAIKNDSHWLFLAHNHPNADTRPSEADIISTRTIISTLANIDVTLIDHIITGSGGAVSMREHPDSRSLSFGGDMYKTAPEQTSSRG